MLLLAACVSDGTADEQSQHEDTAADTEEPDAVESDSSADAFIGDTSGDNDARWNADTSVEPDPGPQLCADDGHWLVPDRPGPAQCDVGDAPRACVTPDGLDGVEACVGYELREDVTGFRWGPCMPRCDEGELNSQRSCTDGGLAGVQFCDVRRLDAGESVELWFGCLRPECVQCLPGETKACGPSTPYPDTLMECHLFHGVPSWFDGNCWT